MSEVRHSRGFVVEKLRCRAITLPYLTLPSPKIGEGNSPDRTNSDKGSVVEKLDPGDYDGLMAWETLLFCRL
jgi:hypothetical protein